jgi:hypothetical protein
MTLSGHERYPHLAAEWHLAKNGGVALADFREGVKRSGGYVKRAMSGKEWLPGEAGEVVAHTAQGGARAVGGQETRFILERNNVALSVQKCHCGLLFYYHCGAAAI